MPSPTRLNNFLACSYLNTLRRAVDAELMPPLVRKDPMDELIRKHGERHEQKYYEELQNQYEHVVKITEGYFDDFDKEIADTKKAMKEGADVIYQGALAYGGWQGIADFLIREEIPSDLGAYSYIIADTKLSKEVKGNAIVQLCIYALAIEHIQGILPDRLVVVGGDYQQHEFRPQNYLAFVEYCKKLFKKANKAPLEAERLRMPEPCDHCTICDWRQHCESRWRAADHLKLVPGVSKKHRKVFERYDITTLEDLAAIDASIKIAEMPLLTLEKLHLQANIQSRARKQEEHLHEYLEVVPQQGFNMLPEPSQGDIWFDIEGDAHIGGDGLEYLFGWSYLQESALEYREEWANNRSEEKRALERFIQAVVDLRQQYPDMHVYHFGHYETTVIKRLSTRYNTMVDAVDDLLRNDVFVDLHRVVKTGLRLSVESYGLKYLEAHYGFERATDLGAAGSARKKVALLLDQQVVLDQEIIDIVVDYNKEDCDATYYLHQWLEDLRAVHPQVAQLMRAFKAVELSEAMNEQLEYLDALANSLYEQLPLEGSLTARQMATKTLADLILWERRESKSKFWEKYRLEELSEEEFWEEPKALGGPFVFVQDDGPIDRSRRLLFSYPEQVYQGDADLNSLVGSDTTIKMLDLNQEEATFCIKVGTGSVEKIKNELASAVGMYDWKLIRKNEHSARIAELAEDFLEQGLEDTDYPLAINLLLAKQIIPHTKSLKKQSESNLQAAVRLVASMPEYSILPIQGPPGTGKTYTASFMIRALVNAGKKVGITSQSHAVIENVLLGLGDEKGLLDAALNIVKVKGEAPLPEWIGRQTPQRARDNEEANVIGATSWFWAHADCREKVDVLFIDEAGQFALVDALACCNGAKKLVLLGDPQQLDNVVQGVHPDNAAVSVLGHWLGKDQIMPPHRGLFLNETFRMAPAVTSYISEQFYESKLRYNGTDLQALSGQGQWSGSGLRYVPVPHEGNQNSSLEEVEAIGKIVDELLQQSTWIDKEGIEHTIGVQDILIVAPYRAQVQRLSDVLPEGVLVGTVDKFQGREAPIVIYSMASSSPEEAPRGMEFLYSANRLNVAISRAKCMAILVASPSLFQLQCKTPRQMLLANNFCRLLEVVGL